MRTFLKSIGWKIPESRERRYHVEGRLIFTFVATREEADQERLSKLRSAIKEVDSRYPWIDKKAIGTPASMDYLSDGTSSVHNWTVPELYCYFRFEPECCLSRSQLYAYEKYVQNLANKLTEMGVCTGKVVATFSAKTTAYYGQSQPDRVRLVVWDNPKRDDSVRLRPQ